jgi:hypothetical protein
MDAQAPASALDASSESDQPGEGLGHGGTGPESMSPGSAAGADSTDSASAAGAPAIVVDDAAGIPPKGSAGCDAGICGAPSGLPGSIASRNTLAFRHGNSAGCFEPE